MPPIAASMCSTSLSTGMMYDTPGSSAPLLVIGSFGTNVEGTEPDGPVPSHVTGYCSSPRVTSTVVALPSRT